MLYPCKLDSMRRTCFNGIAGFTTVLVCTFIAAGCGGDDDGEREYAYTKAAEKSLSKAQELG